MQENYQKKLPQTPQAVKILRMTTLEGTDFIRYFIISKI